MPDPPYPYPAAPGPTEERRSETIISPRALSTCFGSGHRVEQATVERFSLGLGSTPLIRGRRWLEELGSLGLSAV